MLLVRKGAGRYEEMSEEMKGELIDLVAGETLKEYTNKKRPFEFKIFGQKGYYNGKFQQVYSRGRGIPHEFTVRFKGETITLAYCVTVNEESQGGVVKQVLYSHAGKANMQTMGLMFKGAKSMLVAGEDWEKALFMSLYYECQQSPFIHKGKLGTYEWNKPKEKAKLSFAKEKEKLEIQNQILNEIDLFALKSYAQSIGVSNVEFLDEEEIRMLVLRDAMNNIELFKTRLKSSSFNLTGDVYKIFEAGVLKAQTLNNQDVWQYGKGEKKGDIIAILQAEHGDNKLRGITTYMFDNPSAFDLLKKTYFDVTKDGADALESGDMTLAQSESFAEVKELITQGSIYIHRPTGNVYAKFDDGEKEKLFTVEKGDDWEEKVAIFMDENKALLDRF